MSTENIVKSQTLKGGWWDIRPILNTKSDIMICVGQRSNGKTYGVLRFCLQDYKKNKRKFAYVRRWHDDVKATRAQQFLEPLQDEVEKLFGKGYTTYYYRGQYYLIDDEGKKVDVIGYALALSDAHHTKSVPYVDVYNILYDEFIPMGKDRVLDEERLRWENTLSTVLRTRNDAKIFLVANTVSKFSWVFTAYGFSINKVEQGYIYVKEYPTDAGTLRVALEYCAFSEVVGKKASKYTTSNMIKSGAWEIPEVDDIPSVENERVKERLLFTMQEPDTPEVMLGCYLHTAQWYSLETEPVTKLQYTKAHIRQFLVMRQCETRSKYHHLCKEKSLDYHTYNDLALMLKDIKDNCDIDVQHELFMGRIFSDNMYTADYFTHCWKYYSLVDLRAVV